MSKKPVVDPWLLDSNGEPDPFAMNVDFTVRPQDMIDDPDDVVTPITPELQPEVIATTAQEPVVAAPEPPVEPEPEGPEIMQVDGGQVALEKERGQWKATLTNDSGGNPQVYWGKNKNELLANVLKAQLNATRKIRELNRQVKLGGPAQPAQPPQQPTPQVRQLTADEVFDIKTKLESNPDLALEEWFQKKTGLNVNQLVNFAQRGSQARTDLDMESVSRSFMARNPDYYADEQNFEAIVRWVAKYRLGRTDFTDGNEMLLALDRSGNYTVDNLEAAYKDLDEDNLLVRPVAPRVAPPEPPAPAPAPSERIVRTETRPRAALGIRNADVTPAPPPAEPKAPSVEDLDSLSDEQVAALMAQSRRHVLRSRRS